LVREVGTIPAQWRESAEDQSQRKLFMPEICEQCGSGVIKKLLQRKDGTAVLHRECINGHKHHRVTLDDQAPTIDPKDAATSFVIIEACDCT
jgi:hypothetical protein